ncbi:TPA: hypothetical protein ACGOWA_000729 [Streptococcus suis]
MQIELKFIKPSQQRLILIFEEYKKEFGNKSLFPAVELKQSVSKRFYYTGMLFKLREIVLFFVQIHFCIQKNLITRSGFSGDYEKYLGLGTV